MKALGRRLFWSCEVCRHPTSAMSEPALMAAVEEHAEYINRTADREVDPHFLDVRIDKALSV